MIISHAHRFVYVRPKKVASSSVFVALSKHLQPNDMLVGEQGIKVKSEDGGWVSPRSVSRRGFWELRTHGSLQRIIRVLGMDIVNYRIVTLARNPWDRAVSEYFWVRSVKGGAQFTQDDQKDFEAFLKKRTQLSGTRKWIDRLEGRQRLSKMDQSELCTFNGEFIADQVVFFEDLERGMEQLSSMLGVDIKLPEKREKGEIRNRKTRDWQSFYSEEGRQIVANACANDIKLFGYTFDGQTAPSFIPRRSQEHGFT